VCILKTTPSTRTQAAALALASLLAAGLTAGCDKKPTAGAAAGAPPPGPPAPVGVVTLTKRDLPLTIEAVASIDGYVNADIRARVRGYLRSQNYKDGATVKEGETLFTIDSSEYTVAVAAAKATLSRAQTAQSRAKIELDRDVGLFGSGNLSQQDLDNAKAALADAAGQVQAAQAQLDQANLNLSYTNIRSPIHGVAGVAQVRVGNLVGQDQPTLLATVSQTDPIRVNFPLSEVDYVRYPERFRNLDQRDLAWVKKEFSRLDRPEGGDDPGAVQLLLSDGSTFPHRGMIVSLNRNIDATTGTIQMQALFPNPDGLLRPGQYGKVRLKRGSEGTSVIAVSEKALVSVQGQYSLALVGPDNKVALKHVELGPGTGGYRIVLSGAYEGDRIIVDGVAKVTDGSVVDPKPQTDPGPTVALTGGLTPVTAIPAPSTAAPPAPPGATPSHN
jgi:membrane fusion protein (multidrug efflux system)